MNPVSYKVDSVYSSLHYIILIMKIKDVKFLCMYVLCSCACRFCVFTMRLIGRLSLTFACVLDLVVFESLGAVAFEGSFDVDALDGVFRAGTVGVLLALFALIDV